MSRVLHNKMLTYENILSYENILILFIFHLNILIPNDKEYIFHQEKDNVFNMFYLRMHLRRIAYQHATCNAIDAM